MKGKNGILLLIMIENENYNYNSKKREPRSIILQRREEQLLIENSCL